VVEITNSKLVLLIQSIIYN